MPQLPVLIIGAGVAGLSAASHLRAAGIEYLIVEASARIGGRARTVMLGSDAFDLGASWLHDAARNPLVALAREDHATIIDSDAVRTRRVLSGQTPATASELANRAAAWERFDQTASAAPRDIALASAIDSLRADPWTASIEAWEACQIAAADPRDFSVVDWRINALEGQNLALQGGIGAFVERSLGRRAGPVHLGVPVRAIDWRDGITAKTDHGSIKASACIVTVSTAALSRIALTPSLPISTEGLPMGTLTKIALRASGAERLGLRPDESVTARIERDEPMMSCIAWPGGADHAVIFIGGPPAQALSREGEAATLDFVRTRLRHWFGNTADKAFGETIVSNWSEDEWHGGSYAYARPGHAGDRAILGAPLADGRLIIAGEATATDGLAGTVAGAWNEGKRAAATVQAALSRRA